MSQRSGVLPALARTHAEQRTGDVEWVENLVASLPLPSLEDVDHYPRWHASYSREAAVRALLLKHVLGLDSDSALRDAARELADAARDNGLDAPGLVERDDRAGDAGRDGRVGEPSPVVSEVALHHPGTDLLGDEINDDGDDVDRYVVFETNAELPVEGDEDELRRAVQRLTRRYRERWTIENGYKSLKSFIVLTTSKSHTLRYFSFIFACPLFNVWKLIDLLLRRLFGVEDGPVLPAAQVFAAVRRATGIG